MNQCLRCKKPCSLTTLFCDACESLFQNQIPSTVPGVPTHPGTDVSIISTAPHSIISSSHEEKIASPHSDDVDTTIAKQLTTPVPALLQKQEDQPAIENIPVNLVEQAFQRLSDAARRLAAAEPGKRRMPKSSRLSPLHDISAEIQRHSTPLPRVSSRPAFSVDNEQGEDLEHNLPDLWPWLQDPDEIDADSWSDRTDPLIARRFPDSIEAARIEQEDMQRAVAEGLATFTFPVPRKRASRVRAIFASLVVLAILALTIDSILVSVAFLNKRSVPSISSGPPTLTLSSSVVTYGQNVTLHIRHFTSSSNVYVTRDVEEAVQFSFSTNTVGSTHTTIRVDHSGNADVSMYVESTWDSGFHTIEAEDIATRYTASATLRIADAGPTRPPHLIVDDLTVDLGAEPQGANSIRPLRMHNAGSGSIMWSANSNQPWLLLAPNQGTFSNNQTISVGGERANLKEGDYTGTITISSNVGVSITVQVIMTVRALPVNGGPVLAVTPALLSFQAADGGSDPAAQFLVVSNPGTQPLNWSLSNNAPTNQNSQSPVENWLSTDQTKGSVAPHATDFIRVTAHSHSLLPGTYISTLVFNADTGTTNSPQSINISLTVEQPCTLQTGTSTLSFTTVFGQGNPSNQTLSLSASSSCPATITWKAISSVPWLAVNPASGPLKSVVGATATVSVNISGLQPASYNSNITVTTDHSTQSVLVQLVVQPPLPPGAPIISASPANVNFSVTQGQANPPGQVVSITNSGGTTMRWRATATIQQAYVSWLGAYPRGGFVAPGQTQSLVVNVATAKLSAGNYTGQIILEAYDANNNVAGGSPQAITVNLTVLAPCTLAPPTLSSLTFTATQGGGNPGPQSLLVTASGNCAWPVGWSVNTGQPSWLNLSSSGGSFSAGGQSATLSVSPSITNLAPGTYTTQVSISAVDSTNQPVAGSSQSFTVQLNILAQCALQAPAGLTFSALQGQAASAQILSVSEVGSCVYPVAWSATSNNSWLGLSTASGIDAGDGSAISVVASAMGLAPGTYNGLITLSATGSGGTSVLGSPLTIPVTLTVTGSVVSGTVNACADSACGSSTPLAGATVTLIDSAGKQFTAVTDANGKYSMTGVAQGNCTITVNATGGPTHYAGNASTTVAGDHANVPVNALPS